MFKYNNKNDREQSGVSLLLTIIIITILLGIVLGLSTIFLGQLAMFRKMGDSVIALYAADAGIERVLMERTNPLSLDGHSETLDGGAGYVLKVLSSGQDGCTAANFCIKSVGNYREVYRAMEINY